MIENWHFETTQWDFFAQLPKKYHTNQIWVWILLLNAWSPLALSTLFLLVGVINNLLTDPKWIFWPVDFNSPPTASCFCGFMCAQFRNTRHPMLLSTKMEKRLMLSLWCNLSLEKCQDVWNSFNNKNSLLTKVLSVSLVKMKAFCMHVCMCVCTCAHICSYVFLLIILF